MPPDDDQVYVDPAFSRDGRWLTYVTTKPNSNFNVMALPIHSGEWTGPEDAVTRYHDFGSARLYFGNWDLHIEPAWLRDGSGLLLISNRDVALGSGNPWRVGANNYQGFAPVKTKNLSLSFRAYQWLD